ncbi:MAG: AtpZ/AtpI family protein [Lachnospiraceae bacterium]|nr:AtpZ/AtpI family protein [Lachnospiraceae bacterium]
MRSFSMISQFTIHMLVPICMCSYVGYLLDEKFDTSFWFIFLFFIGALAGGRNIYHLAQKISNGKDHMPSKMYGSNQKKSNKKESQ